MTQASINDPVYVNVRVEAPGKTVFEGTVSTRGREVTAETGGTHLCDGTNGNEYPLPGPTCTSALDDASRPRLSPRPFTWDGVYIHQYDDFVVKRIGEFAATETGTNQTYWSLRINYQSAQASAGQEQIKSGDSVLWALIPAPDLPIPLKLKGPLSAKNNVEFIVNVTDGSNRKGVRDAVVTAVSRVTGLGQDSPKTEINGDTRMTLKAGTYDLKARKDKAITSNVLQIVVKT